MWLSAWYSVLICLSLFCVLLFVILSISNVFHLVLFLGGVLCLLFVLFSSGVSPKPEGQQVLTHTDCNLGSGLSPPGGRVWTFVYSFMKIIFVGICKRLENDLKSLKIIWFQNCLHYVSLCLFSSVGQDDHLNYIQRWPSSLTWLMFCAKFCLLVVTVQTCLNRSLHDYIQSH